MFYVWTLLPALYVCSRFIVFLPLTKKIKMLLALAVVAGCEFHLLSRIFFGTMFSPELPTPVMFFLGWFFGCIIFLAILLLIRDVLLLITRHVLRKRLSSPSLKYGMLAMAAFLSAAGVKEATRVPDVHTVDITLPGLAPEFDGYSLVQLTDLHASRLLTRPWMSAVMDKANALHPDLIVVTGDMADGTVKDRLEDVAPLAQLKAPDGVYAITGNHEYYFNAGEWITAYTQLDLQFLNNSHVRIHRGKASFVLAGVTDDIAAQHGGVAPSLRLALRGTIATDTVILLDHKPLNARLSAAEGVSLQLSGHTHGGMIRGLDLAAAPANNGFISGQYQVGNMILYVSNGAGLWNGFPLRLGRPSEITHIRLHTKAD